MSIHSPWRGDLSSVGLACSESGGSPPGVPGAAAKLTADARRIPKTQVDPILMFASFVPHNLAREVLKNECLFRDCQVGGTKRVLGHGAGLARRDQARRQAEG